MRADLLSMSRGADFLWRELHWPASLDEDTCVSLLRQLATDRLVRLVVFEVEATAGAVRYRIGSPEGTSDRVAQLVGALVPGSALSPLDSRDDLTRAWGVTVSPQDRPLVTSGALAISRSLLAALTSMRKGAR